MGKTYVVEQFARKHFERSITINFELHPEYKSCFQSLEPQNILNAIELIANVPIQRGKTLLFFDEIQECPQAIMALRYFKEQMPGLHIMSLSQ